MERYPEPISQQQWRQIASAFDPGLTVQEIQVRWYNVVKPNIPFTIHERRQIVRLAIDHPCDWGWIARQVRNGDGRYATMVRYCATNLMGRLKTLGFDVEKSSDVGLLPDAVLARDGPKGTMRATLLAEYRANKARQAAEAVETTGDAESSISTQLSPLDGESAH
jgi:hypothetical protein